MYAGRAGRIGEHLVSCPEGGRAPAIWLSVLAGEGLRECLPAGSGLPTPGSPEAEGPLSASSLPRGLGPAQVRGDVGGSQLNLGTLSFSGDG